MMMEVRSDFVVSLEIRDALGQVRSLGKHAATVVELEGMGPSANPVPHLHRTSADHKTLASFDADDARMHLTPLGEEYGPGAMGETTSFEIEGLEGRVRQFRWLESDASFAIATEGQLYLVPVPQSSGVKSVKAQVVFAGFLREEVGSIVDVRVAKGGAIVRTEGVSSWDQDPWFGQQVWYMRVNDGTLQELDPLLQQGLGAGAANIAFGEDIVVAVQNADVDRLSEEHDPLGGSWGQLWRYQIPDEGEPVLSGKYDCPDDDCNLSNWAPGSSPLVAVQSWSEIMVFDPSKSEESMVEFSGESLAGVSNLWTTDAGEIVASDDTRLVQYAPNGLKMWEWKAPGKRMITGVHKGENHELIVSAGLDVYKVSAKGKGRRQVRAKGSHPIPSDEDDIFEGSERSFVDQAIPLGNGAMAYTVVDLKSSMEEPDWGPEGAF